LLVTVAAGIRGIESAEVGITDSRTGDLTRRVRARAARTLAARDLLVCAISSPGSRTRGAKRWRTRPSPWSRCRC